MVIRDYLDIKALATINKIKLDSELPKLFGYKSLWGLKLALKNPNKKDAILEKAKKIFL